MARGDDAVELSDWRATHRTVGWLAISVSLVVLPHLARMPLWAGAAFIILSLWRWWGLYRGTWLPGPWLTAALAGAALIGVVLHFGTVLGRDAGVALLTVLAAMKLMETRSVRDAYVVVFLSFFLVITNFLYSQSIATGAYMVVVTILTVATMVSVQHPGEEMSARERLRLAAALVTQALPVMIALFVLFPRVPGPLWGLPEDAHAGRSGLSDTMSPGDIRNLSLSNAVAFRVVFDGEPPPAAQMYWRGPVLDATDGRTWQRRRGRQRRTLDELAVGRGPEVSYEVTLEPTQKRWVFALEMPSALGVRAAVNGAGEMRVPRPIRERLRYRATSSLAFDFRAPPAVGLDADLQLRHGFHPRTRFLAQTWMREVNGDRRAMVQRTLDYFRREPFVYTLAPGLLTGDSVDEFLFLSREGFCEHYASAFTVLMRAAGIPARVVTGYQGGEWNEVGKYWIVRSRDAHAWSEVWIDGEGWVRVDPTSAVAPERIERGMDVAMPESAGDAILGLSPGDPGTQLWRRLRLGWDAVNDSWNQWVLSYGPNSQRNLLSRLGLNSRDWRQLGLVLIVVVGALVLGAALWTALRTRGPRDRVGNDYGRFCAALAKVGVARDAAEGPVDFASRAAATLPHLKGDIDGITRLYVAARYGGDAAAAPALNEAVKRFRA